MFYFANIPDSISLFRLRQYFEVCGILSDIYVARHLNSRGQVYGFVRFLHVRNRVKLAQALKNVWIGDHRVWACEALYDRFSQFDVETRVSARGVRREEVGREVKPAVITLGVGVKNVRVGEAIEVVKVDDEKKRKMLEEKKLQWRM